MEGSGEGVGRAAHRKVEGTMEDSGGAGGVTAFTYNCNAYIIYTFSKINI